MVKITITPSWNLSLPSSSLIFTMIYICTRFCTVVLGGISKPQTNQQRDFNAIIMQIKVPSLTYFYNTTYSIIFVMQNLESNSNFQPEKQCFKIKDREKNKERGTIYFQIIFAVNLCFPIYIFLLLLSMTIFMCRFLSPCDVNLYSPKQILFQTFYYKENIAGTTNIRDRINQVKIASYKLFFVCFESKATLLQLFHEP